MATKQSLQTTSLGIVAKVISGFAFRSAEFCESGIPVIKIKNIQLGTVDLTEIQCVPEHYLSIDSKYHIHQGDILISLTGSHINQPNSVVGRVARYKKGFPKVLLNQRAGKVIIKKPDLCDAGFLFYQLYDENIRRDIAAFAHGAANQANVSPSQIESLDIYLPPLHTQRKIAAILSAYDDLIENNLRRIRILEEMAQNLYREWFVKFRFPACADLSAVPDTAQAAASAGRPGHQNTRFVDSPLGRIPEGWEVKGVGEVALNFDRLRKPLSSIQRAERKGIYPYYGAAKIFDYIDAYIFDGIYLLVAEDGSVVTPDRKPVLQYVSGKFWANNHTHILQGKDSVSTEFLYMVLSEVDITGYITGAAQPKITQANLNRIPVVVAEDSILQTFNEFIREIFRQKIVLAKKNDTLRRTRDLLLPRLISGEMDVSELDIAIPEEAA